MPETVVHFQIRMPPVLHEQLASWAKEDKASLNALIVGILEKAIEQHEKRAQGVTELFGDGRRKPAALGRHAAVGRLPFVRSFGWSLEQTCSLRHPGRSSSLELDRSSGML